jgi:hypothetical protein
MYFTQEGEVAVFCALMSVPPPQRAGPPPASSSRFAPYRKALQALSTRTGTALPSLVVSFAVLHEMTAIVPTVGFFFGARALGVGDRVVQAITSQSTADTQGPNAWIKEKGKQWVEEGGQWAQRVDRRYGVFGYETRNRAVDSDKGDDVRTSQGYDISSRLAGDAANAILAYGLTKVGERVDLTD